MAASPDNNDTNPHFEQSRPYEWTAFNHGESTYLVHDVPEGGQRVYVVSAVTHTVRALATADAVLYDGDVVTPHYDEDNKYIELQHAYAGIVGRLAVCEFLDEPAARLKRIVVHDIDALEAQA